MKPGHGEVLLAEGDPRVREDEEKLIEEFRRQLDEGMWAAVPVRNQGSGRREAQMVKQYADIPPDSEPVIFFPRASGGWGGVVHAGGGPGPWLRCTRAGRAAPISARRRLE